MLNRGMDNKDEKEHPDLLGKYGLGRELEIKGIVPSFHWKNIHSLLLKIIST
jgi:hypothetical protein